MTLEQYIISALFTTSFILVIILVDALVSRNKYRGVLHVEIEPLYISECGWDIDWPRTRMMLNDHRDYLKEKNPHESIIVTANEGVGNVRITRK